VVSQPGRPDRKAGTSSAADARLRRLLRELEELRRAGIFTTEQAEDERRRLWREAGRDPDQ
jgi:hypothetical protein